MVCETWSITDKFFCHFGLFFAHLPTNNLENQNFEWMKQTHGDIIILQMCTKCTINDNHMKYGSWDTEHDGQNFLSFRTIFCPFTVLTPQKIKILKKWRKCLEILWFYKNVPKTMIICYTVPTFFILGYFFALLHPRSLPPPSPPPISLSLSLFLSLCLSACLSLSKKKKKKKIME